MDSNMHARDCEVYTRGFPTVSAALGACRGEVQTENQWDNNRPHVWNSNVVQNNRDLESLRANTPLHA